MNQILKKFHFTLTFLRLSVICCTIDQPLQYICFMIRSEFCSQTRQSQPRCQKHTQTHNMINKSWSSGWCDIVYLHHMSTQQTWRIILESQPVKASILAMDITQQRSAGMTGAVALIRLCSCDPTLSNVNYCTEVVVDFNKVPLHRLIQFSEYSEYLYLMQPDTSNLLQLGGIVFLTLQHLSDSFE